MKLIGGKTKFASFVCRELGVELNQGRVVFVDDRCLVVCSDADPALLFRLPIGAAWVMQHSWAVTKRF